VPDHRLADAFKRANQSHRGAYMLTAGEVLEAWDELKQEKLTYQSYTALPNAGALPPAAPAPLFNLHPLIAELKAWSAKLPSARPDEASGTPFQVEMRRRANFGRYALNVKRLLGYDSIPACVEWVRETAVMALAENKALTWEELLDMLGAGEDQPPDPRAQPAKVCPWCRGMGRVKEYRMGQAVDVKCECAA
jgi:hypothetical protein